MYLDSNNTNNNMTISDSFRKCLSNIPEKHDFKPYWALQTYFVNLEIL